MFKNSSYENAINKYEEAIEILNFERAADDDIRDLQIQSKILCLLNKAACNLKVIIYYLLFIILLFIILLFLLFIIYYFYHYY